MTRSFKTIVIASRDGRLILKLMMNYWTQATHIDEDVIYLVEGGDLQTLN